METETKIRIDLGPEPAACKLLRAGMWAWTILAIVGGAVVVFGAPKGQPTHVFVSLLLGAVLSWLAPLGAMAALSVYCRLNASQARPGALSGRVLRRNIRRERREREAGTDEPPVA